MHSISSKNSFKIMKPYGGKDNNPTPIAHTNNQ
jgi:hypothetical protein